MMKSTRNALMSAVTRAAQLELARKAMEKRKAVGADTIGKRVKVSFWRAPLSKTFGSKGEKALAKTVDAILIGLTPTTGGSSGSNATAVAGSSPSRGDKGKSLVMDSGVTTVNFTLPSNFLADDVVDHRKLFPHLGKYGLPS